MSTAGKLPAFIVPGINANAPDVLFYEFYDDMDGSKAVAAGQWVLTEDDAADTQAFEDVQHGILKLTQKATTDNDASQIVWAQENFKLTSGKRLFYEARIRCPAGDVTNLDFFVGLAVSEDLTGVADNMPANGFGFRKDDGDAYIDACSSDNGTNLETTQIHALVDNTWVRLTMVFDGGATGSGTLKLYVDGLEVGSIGSVTYATMSELAPIFMIRNGDATTTQVLDIDYVRVRAER